MSRKYAKQTPTLPILLHPLLLGVTIKPFPNTNSRGSYETTALPNSNQKPNSSHCELQQATPYLAESLYLINYKLTKKKLISTSAGAFTFTS